MYKVRIDQFEGPFDLLLYLLENARMDIYDIRVTEITEQYIGYLKEMDELNVEVGSEFIVLAAALIRLKSRMLLPRVTEVDEMIVEDDPRTELAERLTEYIQTKKIAEMLQRREKEDIGRCHRLPIPHGSDFFPVTALNRNIRSRMRIHINRRCGNKHVERDSVFLGQNRQAGCTNLICTVTVGRHAVAARNNRVDSAFLHHQGSHIIADYRNIHIGLVQFPGGKTRTLKKRPSFIGIHVKVISPLLSQMNRSQRRSVSGRCETACIAVG